MTGQESKAIRIGQGLTQVQLAILLEVDPSTITRREASEELTREQELALTGLVREREAEKAETLVGGS